MRVSIYKLEDGSIDIMVEAAPGNGKSPVVIQRVTKEDLSKLLAPVLAAQKGRRLPPQESVPQGSDLHGTGTQ